MDSTSENFTSYKMVVAALCAVLSIICLLIIYVCMMVRKDKTYQGDTCMHQSQFYCFNYPWRV